MPKVSILLPTYNSALFLDEAITSALNQTFTDFELIIVDNCSTDNSYDVIAKYLHDKRVRYYKNETNIGVIGNFNKCLSYASGEYIKLLCSDDKFHPEAIRKFVAVMEQFPNVELVASFYEDFGMVSRVWDIPLVHLVKGKTMIEEILYNYNYLGQPTNVMIRKSGLKVGTFRPEYCWLSDWELWLRILTTGDCYIIPEVLTYAREHKNRVSQAMTKLFNNYFENYTLVKTIKEKNELNLDFSKFDIDTLIKRKAVDCSLAIPYTITSLHKHKNRQILKKAFSIAYKEGVLLDSFSVITKKFFKRMFTGVSKTTSKVSPTYFSRKLSRKAL